MARYTGWLSGGPLPPLPRADGTAVAGPLRLPPRIAVPRAPPPPRPDGRREGFFSQVSVAVAEAGRRAWPVRDPGRNPVTSRAVSLLAHAALLAGILLLWGNATIVPAPPPEVSVALTFEDAPAPAQPVQPVPPAEVQPPPPTEVQPPPPIEVPPQPPKVQPEPPPVQPEPALQVQPAPPPPPPVPAELPPAPPPLRRLPARPVQTTPVRPPPPKPQARPVVASPPPVTPTAPPPAAPVTPPVAASAAPRQGDVIQEASLIGTRPGEFCNPANQHTWDISRMRGPAELRISVGADGVPTRVELVTSSGYAKFDHAALEDAELCRFHPALRNGILFPRVFSLKYRPVAPE